MARWLFLAAFLVLAQPVHAQNLTLEIRDGRVTLEATNVPVRQILAEWATIGDTVVVNGERITGAPVSLSLVDVPEHQALDIVLRNVAGYMAAARSDLAGGASRYDRILVLPTSTAPPPVAAAPQPGRPTLAPANQAFPGNQRVIRGPIVQQGEDEGMMETEIDMPVPAEGGNIFVPASPNPMPFGQPGQPFRFPTGTNPGGPPVMMPAEDQPPAIGMPATPQTGPIGSPVPGVVTQPPPPQPLQRPPG
jgi:hypothetical protein